MKRNHSNFPKKTKTITNLTHHKPPEVPLVIWSNSAYAVPNDEGSSVASNSELLLLERSLQENRASVKSSKKKQLLQNKKHCSLSVHGLVCDEEVRLREELGREIEKELERELMDGIMVLVRRLSELKAKQFLREIGEEARILSDGSLMKKKKKKDESRKRSGGVRGEGEMKGRGMVLDEESRSSEVRDGRRWW